MPPCIRIYTTVTRLRFGLLVFLCISELSTNALCVSTDDVFAHFQSAHLFCYQLPVNPDCARCNQWRRMERMYSKRSALRRSGVPAHELPKFTEDPIPNNPHCNSCVNRRGRMRKGSKKYQSKFRSKKI